MRVKRMRTALALVVVGAIGCDGGSKSGRSAGLETSQAALNPSSTTDQGDVCTLSVQGDQVVRHVYARTDGFTFEETRTIDLRSPGGGALSETGSVLHGSQTVFSYIATGDPDGTGTLDITWGHQVRGLTSADIDVAGGKLTGSINNRQFLPFGLAQDPKTAVFVDGKPGPQADFPGDGTVKQLGRLDAAVKNVTGHCELVMSLSSSVAASAIVAAATTAQDTGHFSDTYSTLGCDGCKAGVVASATVACAVICAATFGIGCGACIAGAT